ncbi:MAG TPA: GWxTD domain-containing protein, partial [Chitinophagales bacterium]|nr:GWxTD domain-containing protein [Chitinophagales bacterium]
RVNVFFSEFDITRLLTGNYYLSVEIRNKSNELLALKQLFFQRYKKPEAAAMEDLSQIFIESTFVESLSAEALGFHLRSVLPISNVSEARKIKETLKSRDQRQMQQMLLFFWLARNADNPRGEWQKYQAEVKKVNDNFGTPLEYGFETDRGRVYLQYGPPTEILESVHEPGALPYEIWHYNTFEMGQTNVKFVFYNPDLVSNNYVLIHSTANGEIKNEQWQRVIYERFSGGETPLDPGGTPVREHFGSKANQYYNKQ